MTAFRVPMVTIANQAKIRKTARKATIAPRVQSIRRSTRVPTVSTLTLSTPRSWESANHAVWETIAPKDQLYQYSAQLVITMLTITQLLPALYAPRGDTARSLALGSR